MMFRSRVTITRSKNVPVRTKNWKHRYHKNITRCQPTHGFTLIELLIVIAIIALLVSILLPSLTKAKELAKGIVCTNKLRNIGYAFSMYSNDSDGLLPYSSTTSTIYDRRYGNWSDAIFPYICPGKLPFPEFEATPGATEALKQLYVDVYFCPCHPSQTYEGLGNNYHHNYGLSYSTLAHDWDWGPHQPPKQTNIADIEDTSREFYLADTGEYNVYHYGYGYTLGWWHINRSAVLYVDNHIQMIPYEDPDPFIREFTPRFRILLP